MAYILNSRVFSFVLCSCLSVSTNPLEGSNSNINSKEPYVILGKSVGDSGPLFKETFRGSTENEEKIHVVTASSVSKVSRHSSSTSKTNVKDSPSRITDNNHWVKITSFNITETGRLPVVKYKSNLTGLTVVLAEAESPIVNGYFCLATEAQDNDGLPHTLEHLVFLGSEDYPYKEVLDLLANRCLADRTNAWTDTDHTCYTVYTAGPSGFLHILPVYLDHILYPLLRKEDYLTEVHHINGEGQDAGVVYSEMQGVEHSSANIMYFAMAQKLYPESGFNKETGGYLKNLRESTNIEKVRAYHKKFYRPENIVLTITGKINEEALFNTLRQTEEKILQKWEINPPSKFVKPWQDSIKKLNLQEDLIFEKEYPSEDESVGNVAVAWRLPVNISDDIEQMEAYSLILKYLTNTQVSPFEAEFVENSDPLATSVSSDKLEVREPALLIEFENVPLTHIDEIPAKMDKLIEKIVKAGPSQFDLERIHNFIDREVINHMKEVENSPHLFLPDATVLDMLYGEKPEHLRKFVQSSQLTKNFKNKPASFWIDLIKSVFQDMHKIIIKGKPSAALVNNFTEEEEIRIAKQIKDLGTQGLKDKGKEIEDALESQKLPGKEVLNKIPLGDVDIIKFRNFESFNRTQNYQKIIDFANIPFKIQIDDVKSNFAQFYIFMETNVLSDEQKKYLPLLLDLWLESPIMKNGKITSIDKMVKRRTKSLLLIESSLGFSGSTFSPGAYGDTIIIGGQAELKKFSKAINYIHDAINFPHITKNKVNTTAANILNNIPSLKLSATDVLSALFDGLYFSNKSNVYHASFLRQKAFLDSIINELDTNPDKVLNELNTIIKTLARPDNSFMYMATDATELTTHYGKGLPLLNNLFNNTSVAVTNTKEGLISRFSTCSEYEYRRSDQDISGTKDVFPNHVALGVGGTESCYMKQYILYNNTDWTSPEVTAVRVALQYLSDRMYDEVRGQGLTYGISMSASVTEGRLTLSLDRSSRLTEAYTAVREIIKRYVENPDSWDSTLVDSAIGSLVYSWTEKEETVEDMVSQAVKAYMRKTDSKFNRQFVRSLGKVSLKDLQKVASSLLPDFLSPSSSSSVVVCNPSAVEQIVDDLAGLGLNFTSYSSIEDTFLNIT